MNTVLQLELNSNLSDKEFDLLTDIGYALEKGTAFKQDYVTALTLYKAAAKEGSACAMNNLADTKWIWHKERHKKCN